MRRLRRRAQERRKRPTFAVEHDVREGAGVLQAASGEPQRAKRAPGEQAAAEGIPAPDRRANET
jgi:hypothetical protein